MRVLIVEDDIIIAMHLAILVAEFGYEVVGTVRLPLEPIEFVGKPVMPVVLQRALRKAEALLEP
jgi:AmiR/NasT family two-component response regulator